MGNLSTAVIVSTVIFFPGFECMYNNYTAQYGSVRVLAVSY